MAVKSAVSGPCPTADGLLGDTPGTPRRHRRAWLELDTKPALTNRRLVDDLDVAHSSGRRTTPTPHDELIDRLS